MSATKVRPLEIENLMGRSIPISSKEAMRSDIFRLFDLNDYFPGFKLLVNISTSIVSLLSEDHEEDGCIVVQRILTEVEMRMLFPLLASPNCCRREVLQASYYCRYEFLLQSMLFSNPSNANVQWDELVQEHHHRLWVAQQKKTKRTEMRGVYNSLFGLKQKLEQFGLTIRLKKEGYYLSLLVVE